MHKPSDVYIKRAAAFLPNPPVSNEQMEAVLGMTGDTPSRVRKMILRSNAITSRYYAIDPHTRRATHSNTELAALAVRGLLEQGLRADEIGSLACGTSYPDQILPGHAVMVHGLLPQIPPCEVVSTAGVCVAGMAAMKQDVKLLNENIVAYTVEKPLRYLIAKHGLQADKIDWFLPHYSSGFFRSKLADGLAAAGLPIAEEKWFTNLHYKGNTGSAAIYIILEEF
ncbi:MAG: 3-oxoacyl-[acyl-carrier-protein] synthase III C-terminal domain-containing protein, partial [Eikenella corrodens]|uniref:3-oxoacyl-[acyl-carrier-protein] synthase III C-terminal domain-containing protein n=1 Tax=Eikenella corrodens TaxID=539 RepID=UPI00291469B3